MFTVCYRRWKAPQLPRTRMPRNTRNIRAPSFQNKSLQLRLLKTSQRKSAICKLFSIELFSCERYSDDCVFFPRSKWRQICVFVKLCRIIDQMWVSAILISCFSWVYLVGLDRWAWYRKCNRGNTFLIHVFMFVTRNHICSSNNCDLEIFIPVFRKYQHQVLSVRHPKCGFITCRLNSVQLEICM